MMAKFYICEEKHDIFEEGALIKYENGIYSVLGTDKIVKHKTDSKFDFLTEVSNIKMNYLYKIDKSKRLKIFKSGLFEEIEKLKIYDTCVVRSKTSQYQFSIHCGMNKENKLIVIKDKGTMPIYSWDIISVSSAKFYICLAKCLDKEAGQMWIDHGNRFENNDQFKKISREEADFLDKHPREERPKLVEDKFWEKINKLEVGDKCYIKTKSSGPPYTIFKIDTKDDTLIFNLCSGGDDIVRVDASEIRPWKKTVQQEKTDLGEMGMRPRMVGGGAQMLTRGLDPLTEGVKREETTSIDGGRSKDLGKEGPMVAPIKKGVNEGSTRSLSKEGDPMKTTKERDGRGSVSSLSSLPSILSPDSSFKRCKKTGLEVLNPKNNNKIDTMKVYKVLERYFLLKDGTSAKLKWKGVIDSRLSIGLELDKVSDYGCHGRIDNQELFTCQDKRGVFISVASDKGGLYQTCEKETGAFHNLLKKNKDKIIEMDNICCFYDDILHRSDYEKREIILTDGSIAIGTCSVFLNGTECVGMQLNKNTKMIGYKNEMLAKKLNIKFDALIDVKDIPNNIRCHDNNLDIVNPSVFKSAEEGNRYNKLLSLKQGNTSMIVGLRWKGRVNGMRCLGCELSKACKYGTNGTFQGRKLFECADKRGVLILVDGNVECCESGARGAASSGEKGHNKIEADLFIDERCICCAEEDKLGSKSGFNIDQKLIFKEDLRGTVQWVGLINGERCLGLEVETETIKSDGRFNGMRLFNSESKKGVLVKMDGICKSLRCANINMNVLNPTLIKAMNTVSEISAYVVIRTIDHPPVTVDVKWTGKVDGMDCVGCVLDTYYRYGTNGTFMGDKLFTCEDYKGVLIAKESFPNDCFSSTPRHKECDRTARKNIPEESICCMECKDELTNQPQMNVGSNIRVKGAKHDLFGKCAWTGLINGQEVVGMTVVNQNRLGTDGKFCGIGLFECDPGCGFLYLAKEIEKVPDMIFIKDMYLASSFDLSMVERSPSGGMVGGLVYVDDNLRLYGRVTFQTSLFGETVMGIKINDRCSKEDPEKYKCILFRDDIGGEGDLIIVRSRCVSVFNERLATLRGSCIIDRGSVKVQEGHVSNKVKNGDLVRYVIQDGECYGRVVSSHLLNGVPCLELEDSINMTAGKTERRYILEEAATKVPDPRSSTKYHQGSIIDPRSISTFISSENEDLVVNGEVEFRLKYSLTKFQGKILMLAKANEIPVAVVGLHSPPRSTEISQYFINQLKPFKDLVSSERRAAVVVVANIVHSNSKKVSWCGKNQVSVVDPAHVKTIIPKDSADKLVLLDSKGVTIRARLKWIGHVNGDFCIGCEMRNESLFGTNGRFGDQELFKCAEGTGLLIPLTEISAGCINGPHKELDISSGGRITGKNICCAETSEKLRHSLKLKVGDRVKRINDKGNVLGTCRWVGLVNDKGVIGVEMAHCGVGVKDECVDMLALFNCVSDKGALFLYDGFILDPIGLCYCTNNNSFIVDHRNVHNMTNGRVVHKKMICRADNNNTVIMDIKWQGDLSGVPCVGCEQNYDCECGTGGEFGDEKLFSCEDGKGVLIPLTYICDCCINGEHKKLDTAFDGLIKRSSVCCAERLEEYEGNWKLGDRVMRIGEKASIFGTCQWVGLVNDEEVIGLEMVQSRDRGLDRDIDKLALWNCPSDKGVLFISKDFKIDPVGRRYCSANNLFVVGGDIIKSVENGKVLKKRMEYVNSNDSMVILDIKWKGDVNGEACLGCELKCKSKYGTNGVFGKGRLFESSPDKGVLIPVNSLIGSCELGGHREFTKHDTKGVNVYSLCCVETLEKIDKWPQMEKGSKIRFKSWILYPDKIGKCKWMGRVNGKESVGVEMRENIKHGTNGTFTHFEVFKCKEDRGVMFLSEDIEHDISGESVHFLVDKFLDVSKIWKWKKSEADNVKGIKIGDCVSTYMNEIIGAPRMFDGELKCIGRVFGTACVGIDLEDKFSKGMDGVIDRKEVFSCPPRHGVVTTVDNVERKNITGPSFTADGTIDPNKYLRCEERWKEESLRERKVCKDGPVFVIIECKNKGRWKWKGTLRWCGSMNGESVAVVELNQDYELGTDGLFWRHQLIKCGKKRAVAVKWDNIHQYMPYEKLCLALEERTFQEIDINSAVIYYFPKEDRMVSSYGTVRWSGVREDGVYLYGLDLDDRCNGGTDGEFDGYRLFQCQNGHGVLASISTVAPDTRFLVTKVTDDQIVKSKITDRIQYSIPVKSRRGENCGIQGNTNSCYFDSSIFALLAKSDVLDFMISPIINEREKDEITKEFRNILAYKIVHPLREFGFVSFHYTQEMRDVIRNYGEAFEEMTKQETDMENVAALLAKLCPANQLLSFTSFNGHINKAMFLQLFIILDKPITNISSQQMLEISMAQSDIMFDKPPTCLIMQAPRDAKGINCYTNALPSKTIEISNLCHPCFKKCSKCDSMATMQCKKCIERMSGTKHGLFCEQHKCEHEEILTFPVTSTQSRSEVQMELKAVICIEKAHFVTYVKEDEFKKEWVYFDSMSTQDISSNYAIPKVSFEKRVSDFLGLSVEEMEADLDEGSDVLLKRIVKDSYIFVYHNTSMTCY